MEAAPKAQVRRGPCSGCPGMGDAGLPNSWTSGFEALSCVTGALSPSGRGTRTISRRQFLLQQLSDHSRLCSVESRFSDQPNQFIDSSGVSLLQVHYLTDRNWVRGEKERLVTKHPQLRFALTEI